MVNIAEFCIRHKLSTLVLTAVLVVGGLVAYQGMGRLEDPEFTIKDALVITSYPGATAEEVEREVTDIVEKAVQKLSQLDEIESRSQPGLSTITVTIKDKYDKTTLPQVWDELRRKVSDAEGDLPPGAGMPSVIDDFGDVFGIFFAVTGDGYTVKELEDYAEFLQRELLLVQDVAKIDIFGAQPEAVYIELFREKLSQFGLTKEDIYKALSDKNLVANSGRYKVGREYIGLRPTGEFTSVEEFGELLITAYGAEDDDLRLVYLKDVARIAREYVTPPQTMLRMDGKPAVGIAISTVSGGNVVVMGDALQKRLQELETMRPVGIEFHRISIQSEAVTAAISGFVISLLEAVVIVIIVLMLFMGLRSGILIGAILFITILGSFIFMSMQGIMLERISLGALIIALGMLVDNAIVVTDGILVRIQKGEERVKAAAAVVSQNQIPLLGATVVAVTAFAAIGTSQDSTGEYCRSLFQVIMISLLFSWVTAVTVTPVLCVMFLRADPGTSQEDPYNKGFYAKYRRFLAKCLKMRWPVCVLMVGLLVVSLFGFKQVKQSFFPNSTRPQFMIDFWMPEGTHIEETAAEAATVEEYLLGVEGVAGITTGINKGLPRFLLTYSPEKTNPAYAFFLVSVDDYKQIDSLMQEIQTALETDYPHTIPQAYKFMLGPGDAQKIQIRFMGPEISVIRDLSEQATDIMHADGGMIGITTDARTMIKDYRPIVSEAQARRNGIDRPDIAKVLRESWDGRPVATYREGNELLSIISRVPESERGDLQDLENMQIHSPAAGKMIPLRQIVAGFETEFVDSIIMRKDRTRMITAKCNPRTGLASEALQRILPQLQQIEIPAGYRMELGGEYEDSSRAKAALFGKVPLFLLMMVLIVILLFDSLRKPLVIWLTVPLAVIGVTVGLLGTNQPFGFMALLGFMSLTGMLIKNAIVLVDEIGIQTNGGLSEWDAVLTAGVSRMRPVLMAAATTVLGMIPLIFDAFFVSMAVTIMAGLTFASILTLVVVPVLYVIIFKIPSPPDMTAAPEPETALSGESLKPPASEEADESAN